MSVMLLLAATALWMFAVACGDDDDDGEASTPVASQPPAEATEPTGETPVATEPVYTVRPVEPGARSGQILVNGDATLYTFDNDVAGSGASACDATCAETWPPLSVPNPTASDELTGEIGTMTRDDGSPQVTYKGKPLYLYSVSPLYPGGDGVGGVWHVARP